MNIFSKLFPKIKKEMFTPVNTVVKMPGYFSKTEKELLSHFAYLRLL